MISLSSFRAVACNAAVRVSFALVLASAVSPVRAADPLTLDEALRLAQERSRQLPAQEAAAKSAREMAVAAGQRPDPILTAGVNDFPISRPNAFSLTRDAFTMRQIGVTQELTRGSKLQARAARLEREAEVAAAGRELALANLQRDTAIAWLDRYYQERVRDVLVSQRDEAHLQIDASDAAYRGGRGSQSDLFAARSAVASIEDRIDQSERQIATAKTQLARWIGLPSSEPLAAIPSLAMVDFRPDDLDMLLAHHPELAVLQKMEDMAQADVEVARADKKPDVSVGLMYNQSGPAYSNYLSITLSVPLQWDQSNRQDRAVSAKLATLEQRHAEREEAGRMHVAEDLAMWQEWQSNRARLVRYDNSIVPLAAERTRAAVAAYRGASASLGAVLESRRGEIDVRLERLRLEMETARLWAKLNYLVPRGTP